MTAADSPSGSRTRTPRPSDLQRSTATRQRILTATVASLARHGLAGTSTVQIQADAGVSRGGLLHQYGSREQLLVAAVQHLASERFAALRAQPIELEGAARVRRALELLWSTHDSDLFWAAMQTWLGARSDPQLQEVLRLHERQLGHVARGLCDDVFGEELIRHEAYSDLRETLITSMRGVALTYAFDPRPAMTDPHLDAWFRLSCRTLGIAETSD